MLLNVLEVLMILLYVLARCAATVAICYYTLMHYGEGDGKFWIIVIAIAIGLGFSLKYKNPNNKNHIEQAPPTFEALGAPDKNHED